MMLCCTFHIRKSSIESAGQKWPPSVEFDSHHYAPAGHDQIRMTVWDDTPGTIARVIAKPAFKTAAKHLNLQLMRRGANLNARSHSFGVADVIFSSNSPANKVQP